MILLWLVACGGVSSLPELPEAAPIAVQEASRTPPAPVAPAPPLEARYAATHALIAYQGAVSAPPHMLRSEAEARALALELRQSAIKGRPMDEIARAYSSGPSAGRGGSLGVFATGTMVPAFEEAVASVRIGEIAPVVQTPYGFHVVRRDAVMEAHAAHILVSWAGAAASQSSRSKDAARAHIEQAKARLEHGESWALVESSCSEDDTTHPDGDLGRIAPGQMVPAFEQALFALAPGQVSAIVETPYGFHLIRRLSTE